MKPTITRIVALIAGLLVLITAPAFGAPKVVNKEEIVYAHLGGDGTVSRVYVVNAFADPTGTITDYGQYTEVVNLTDTSQLTRRDDRVEIATKGGDFYYQGELASREMPWRLGFEYLLDGRQISASELLGASGELEIRIKVRANEQVDPVYFDHYMLQIQINLENQYFSEVVSEGATIAAAGETRVVNLTSMPGKASDFVIRTQANNAHLGQIQVVGLPFEMFLELPDPAQYTADLLLLQDAIAQLATGMTQFSDGVQSVGAAADQLSSGASELAAGATEVASGFDQLAAGRGEFDAALRLYTQGVSSLAAGLAGLSDGIDQSSVGSGALTQGIAELSDGLAELTNQGKYADPSLVSGSQQILTALETLDAAMTLLPTDEELQSLLELLQTFSESFNDFATAVDATDFEALMTQLNNSLAALDTEVGRIEQVAAQLQDSDAIVAELGVDPNNADVQALLDYMAAQGRELDAAAAQLRTVRDALAGLDPVIRGVLESLSTLAAEYETVRGLLDGMNPALQAISPGQLQQLKDGVKALSANYRTFHEGLVAYVDGVEQAYLGVSGDPGLLKGAQQLQGGLGQLAEGAGQLSDGAEQLADGGPALVDGHGQMMAGDASFGSGLWRYADGVADYNTGIAQYLQGVGELGAAAQLLSGGANTLRDQTTGMDQQMADKIDEAMAEYLPGDYDLVSFTDSRNSGVERVQFIYLIDAQTEPEPPSVDEPDDDRSWWQRILDIFR